MSDRDHLAAIVEAFDAADWIGWHLLRTSPALVVAVYRAREHLKRDNQTEQSNHASDD